MVNRNSARHLLFVVSILLCFFIYMGYRFLGSGGTQDAVTQYPPFEEDIASPSPAAPGSRLAPSTDVSVPIDDGDSSWVSAMPASPSSSPASQALPMPPASSSSPSSTSHSGAITGLIPSPPADTRPPGGDSASGETAVASLPSLPIPGGNGSSAGGSDAGIASAPSGTGSSGTGLRPPSDDWEGMEDDEEVADLSDLSFMPSSPGASSSPPRATSPSGNAAEAPPAASVTTPPAAAVTPPPPPSTRPSYAAPSDDEPEWSRPAPGRTSPPPAAAAPPAPAGAPAAPARPDGPSPYGPYQELPESLRIYVVLPGDTLTSIAARELGSASLAENIFLLNRDAIEDPDHLMVGVRIRLPVRENIAPVAEPAPPDTPGRRPVMGLGRTHIVVRGDTLSSIAQQYYGSSSGWRFLYEANRTAVPNPNQLTVGMELTIPPFEQ